MDRFGLGVERGKIKLVEYNRNWTDAFELEKSVLLTTLGQNISSIHHVGSTAIPGLLAKPIIDILLTVQNLSLFNKLNHKLNSLNYQFRPDPTRVDRYFFAKGKEHARTHYLHIAKEGSLEARKQLAFRDYLRNHKEKRNEYNELKKALQAQYDDRRYYTAGKSEFIREVLELANISY